MSDWLGLDLQSSDKRTNKKPKRPFLSMHACKKGVFSPAPGSRSAKCLSAAIMLLPTGGYRQHQLSLDQNTPSGCLYLRQRVSVDHLGTGVIGRFFNLLGGSAWPWAPPPPASPALPQGAQRWSHSAWLTPGVLRRWPSLTTSTSCRLDPPRWQGKESGSAGQHWAGTLRQRYVPWCRTGEVDHRQWMLNSTMEGR